MSRPTIIRAGFVLLLVLHQDFWWKNDPTLVFSFLPVSLAYHVVWTLLVAVAWYFVGRCCWPAEVAEAGPAETGPLPPVAPPPGRSDR